MWLSIDHDLRTDSRSEIRQNRRVYAVYYVISFELETTKEPQEAQLLTTIDLCKMIQIINLL